jgi:hypothetical protein
MSLYSLSMRLDEFERVFAEDNRLGPQDGKSTR